MPLRQPYEAVDVIRWWPSEKKRKSGVYLSEWGSVSLDIDPTLEEMQRAKELPV